MLTLYIAKNGRGYVPYWKFASITVPAIIAIAERLNVEAFYIKDADGSIVYTTEEN